MNKIAQYQESNEEGEDEDLEVSFYDLDVKIEDFKKNKYRTGFNTYRYKHNNENFLPREVLKEISDSRKQLTSQTSLDKRLDSSENRSFEKRTASREILKDRSIASQFSSKPGSRDSVDFNKIVPGSIGNKNNASQLALRDFSKFKKRLSSAELDFVIDQYEILEFIGKGAFGKVYKAQNKYNHQKIIAIKEIIINDSAQVKELMSEINLLKKLKHPNIVKYHGFIQRNFKFNIYLEYCDGGSLKQYCSKLKKLKPNVDHVVSENSIIFYTKQILKGLEYLHNESIIHRDIKAANILLSNNNQVVKLTDFGVSTIMDTGNYNNTVVGTPNWMAPEVITLETFLSSKSDIWSLGSTIIELFTGHPPYHTLNSMAALHAIVTDKHPDLPKNFSNLAKDFLKKCYIKDYRLRWDATQLLNHPWLNQSSINFNGAVVRSPHDVAIHSKSKDIFSKSLNSSKKSDVKLPKRAVTNPDILRYVEKDLTFKNWKNDFSKLSPNMKTKNYDGSLQ